ncbi:hypothetical protein Egran_04825 [Elaphomyces granulatus]|uniref:Spindle pole body component n=1 Tax=Elaphomyces granulatus TaxID=519963 RepID=A0A232LTK2_9EURO|nr:hypothetical protein Egran_04825 [Elaphomyces granulatus]
MDSEECTNYSNPFTVNDLWESSKFTLQPLRPLDPSLDTELPTLGIVTGVFDQSIRLFEKNDSILYELNVFGSDAVEPGLTTADTSSVSHDNHGDNVTESRAEELDNIWAPERTYEISNYKRQLQSWDGFLQEHFTEPASAYLSEYGARGFDAALAHEATVNGLENSGRLVKPDVFYQSLFWLGLGWNSMFFEYNEQKRVFEKRLRDTRISGISLPALDGMIQDILRCGSDIQKIRRFIRTSPAVSTQPTALSSLASIASVIVYSLEKQLSVRYTDETSIIEIHILFQRCGDLVFALADIIDAAKKVKSEGDVISVTFEKCDNYVQRFTWMAEILHEVIGRVTRTWLTQVETWVGLREETSASIRGNHKEFVGVNYSQDLNRPRIESRMLTYFFHADAKPSFMPPEQAQLIFESGKGLRLLKQASPQHPIARNDILSSCHPPSLRCGFTWEDIERIQRKADEYEFRLRAEVLRHNQGDYSELQADIEPGHILLNSEGDTTNDAADTFELIDLDDTKHRTGLLAEKSSFEGDNLYKLLAEKDYLDLQTSQHRDRGFGPPLSAAFYLSLAPTLSSQARVIDYSCLHLLFKEHRLQHHLTLQWRFQLLGDGSFVARLSHSLFDPEMESGERRSGVTRSGVRTGLRLGSRDTWPPASSELRLVLMGLLTECHAVNGCSPFGQSVQNNRKEKELPGGLSFAIRELTGEELVKCRDPNAIEALDFLRLQYKPPAVLETIITARSLHKYDVLFKHLLRLTRMLSVVSGLVRDSTARSSLSGDCRNIFQKFRIDAQHFVIALCDYSFHTGVGFLWKRFEKTLSKVERYLDRGDIDSTIETAGSLCKLRDYHEEVLDQMLFSLFLSKSHQQAGKLLENIFTVILTFAPLSRLDGLGDTRYQNENAELRRRQDGFEITWKK